MKAISKGGIVLPVDDSGLDYEQHYTPCIQFVALVGDDMFLEDAWLATGYKNLTQDSRPDELEFKVEKIFRHAPTDEELMYFMAENGLSIYDYCQVSTVKRMYCHFD